VRRQTLPALLAAERLFFNPADSLTDRAAYYHELPPLEIHIFEDAAGGVRAV